MAQHKKGRAGTVLPDKDINFLKNVITGNKDY